MSEMLAERLIREVPDFPRPGISFKDITPLLADGAAFQEVIDQFVEWIAPRAPDVIVGIESRGFLFAAPAALALGLGLVLVRKQGKLPSETLQQSYDLEYGLDAVEIHRDALLPGQRVVIMDDVLATGGTASAAARLVEASGAVVVGCAFLIELLPLLGRQKLSGYAIQSLLAYSN